MALRLMRLLGFVSLFARLACALADTDTITWGGDVSRSGYETNHNMDPAVVGSADFGQIWRAKLPGNFNGIGPEQIFSQPLVYTLADGIQYVFIATTQNNVYKINAKTGDIVASRNLHVPFLTADLDGCVDINPTVGVTATGVIDPATGYWYFTSKTYADQFQDGKFSPQAPPGRRNGRYYFHAINTNDLSEAPGFPTLIDGTIFRNNPRRMFIGGDTHQRPALLQVGDYIYTGWASHCVQYNFTGAIIGFHRTTGKIVEAYAMQGGPEPIDVKGGGVWMSGGGLSYDGKGSMYFATGNGYASQLPADGRSVQGRNPPTALEEAAVNMRIGDNGTITPVDFFMPWEKTQLDGADKDLGTTPLQLLPGDTFSCPNDRRIGVVTGKSGKTYWLNLDNLGGYQMGANKLDDVIQVYQNENSVYAGAGVMPLGGGYIYINVIQFQTHVFKFGCNAAGRATFTKVADTTNKNAYILGVGHGTTTSLKGRDGSGLLWTTDVEGQNLRIYDPIPPSGGGDLRQLKGFNIPGVTKFSRPVFGDGRAYVGTTQGFLYAFGSPVNLPLNCSSPYTFQPTPIGNTSIPLTITCTANTATTVTGLNLTGNANFVLSGLPTVPLQLAAGDKLSFKASFAPKTVGTLSSDVLVATNNGMAGFSANTPITLTGAANSAAPLLYVSPNTVSFSTIAGQGASTQTAILGNSGDSLLTLTNVSYSIVSEQGPWVTPNTTADGSVQVGAFTFSGVPSTISPNSNAVITITYNPTEAGNTAVYITAFSNGGNKILDVLGTAGSQPKVLFEFQSLDGKSWIPYTNGTNFTFGDVFQATTKSLTFRITNNGSSTAAPLSLTVSKPPFGVPGIVGAVNNIDLAEGTIIAAGQSKTATLFCAVPERQINTPSFKGYAQWTINTNDPVLGKKDLIFNCNAVAQQVGPLLTNGTAQFGYLGCYQDITPGRQLAVQPYGDNNNTNGRCLSICRDQGWKFAGTQYTSQCWCGNALPLYAGTDDDCNYRCTGAQNETCGGNGVFHNQTMISLFVDANKYDGVKTSPPLSMVKSTGLYSYIGCYKENGAKSFTQKSIANVGMTVEACRDYCGGTNLMGLQYGQECWCGTTIASTSTLVADSDCSMTCKGNNSEYCGAGSRMQAYQLAATLPQSSSSSSSAASSTLTTAVTSPAASSPVPSSPVVAVDSTTSPAAPTSPAGSSSATTLSSPATSSTTAVAASSTLSSPASSPTSAQPTSSPTSPAASSSPPASSSPSTLSTIASPPPATTTTSPAAVTTTTTATPTPTGPSPYQIDAYLYQGCYNEVNGRALTAKTFANASLTNQLCAAFCRGSLFFATEYSTECYCGDALSSSSLPVTDGRCNMKCANDTTQICGGPNGLTLYKLNSTATTTTTATAAATVAPTPAKPTVVPTASGYASMGCYSEKPNGRALATLYYNKTMTVPLCAGTARQGKYKFFGVEYGTECWMGNVLDAAAAPVAQTKCGFTCPGDAGSYCGAGGTLQMYNLTATV